MAEEQNPFSNIDFTESRNETTALLDTLLDDTVSHEPEEIIEKKDEPVKKDSPLNQTEEDKKKIADAKAKAEEEKKKALEDVFGDDEEEPTKKKVEEVPKEEEEEDDESETEEESTFTKLSKELANLGVFQLDEGEETIDADTPEKFLERFKYETSKQANVMVDNFISQFGPDHQHAFQSIFVKGVDPKDYFSAYNDITDLNNLDLSVEANQERVVKQALKEQGFDSNEDINAELEKIKNYGDLEEKANRYHKILVKNQTSKLVKLEEQKQEELQEKAAIKQQFSKSVVKTLEEKLKAKEFDGIPINNKLANELHDYLLAEKWKTQSGETLTDFDKAILDLKKPENHQLKVKVALLLKTLEKDPTLSTIQKAGVSKETNQIFNDLVIKKEKSAVKNKKQQTSPFSTL